MVTAETLPSGLRLVTESMPHVRSVTVGVWLVQGSRHETEPESGIAHFIEHMLFKGTTSRTARQIAQTMDSIGGQLDAFTSKEYASYYVKVLDEHLPVALDLLADMVMRPALAPDDILREQSVILEEIKMVEDAPDDLVHEVLTQQFWSTHPLGRPILGTPETVSSFDAPRLRDYFTRTYIAPNLIIAAAGNLEHAALRDRVARVFAELPTGEALADAGPPAVTPGLVVRQKDIEQCHLCLAAPAYAQAHDRRHAAYVLNTILGGSMSSRLFQHIREDRGLAYAVMSGLASYRDAGMISVYAGCAVDKVHEVMNLTLAELRGLREAPVPADELARAREHLKGSLMLGLESTSSRMSYMARQEIYFGRHDSLGDVLAAVDAVTADDVQAVSTELFQDSSLVATLVGPKLPSPLEFDQVRMSPA
jgi:predicted Zn-dependent peptidase